MYTLLHFAMMIRVCLKRFAPNQSLKYIRKCGVNNMLSLNDIKNVLLQKKKKKCELRQ